MLIVEDLIRLSWDKAFELEELDLSNKDHEALSQDSNIVEWETENDLFSILFGEFPQWPPDMFAVVGMIAKRTGAYSFVRDGIPSGVTLDWIAKGFVPQRTDAFGLSSSRQKLLLHANAWRHGIILIPFFENMIKGSPNAKEDLKTKLAEIELAISNDRSLSLSEKRKLKELCGSDGAQRDRRKVRMDMFNYIQSLWQILIDLRHLEVVLPIGPWEFLKQDPERMKLFEAVLKLLIIADEACTDIDKLDFEDNVKKAPWINGVFAAQLINQLNRGKTPSKNIGESTQDKVLNKYIPWTPKDLKLNINSNANFSPVLPKGRTTSLGCSLRSMSRNIGLAPITTEVNAKFGNFSGYKNTGLFNLLAIPYPFDICHNCFQPSFDGGTSSRKSSERWRWFHVQQTWIDALNTQTKRTGQLNNLSKIIDNSQNRGGEIHGVVLPELSLDFNLFVGFADVIAEQHQSIEVLVAGTSNALVELPKGQLLKPGNFVCTAIFEPLTAGMKKREYSLSVQHKHHRWKLTHNQIVDYGISHTLNPMYDWWENTNISTRALNFWAFRENSILSTLICEDLARNDPAHQVLRTIGPNLVIALLMDGPQLDSRWPGRYASMLSEDPGASVLTLTSGGLLHDRKGGGRYDNSYQVALWSEPGKPNRVLDMGENNGGILLNLQGVNRSTQTLDGRHKPNSAKEWRLVGVKEVEK